MALQVSLSVEETGIGVEIPKSYARVSGFQWQADKFYFVVEYHWDAEARKNKTRAVGAQTFVIENVDFSVDTSVKKICYDHLKTLPVFKDALDV